MSSSMTWDNSLTTIAAESEHGLLRGIGRGDNVWLYARIPWAGSLLDGASDQERETANNRLLHFFDQCAHLVTTAGLQYRNLLQNQYREFHILTTNMPEPYTPPHVMQDSRLGRWLQSAYQQQHVRHRCAIIGIRLIAGHPHTLTTHHEPWSKRLCTGLDHLAFTLHHGIEPFDSYQDDAHTIEQFMLNAGLEPFSCLPTNDFQQMKLFLQSWWVPHAHGEALPILCENSHLHVFPDVESCTIAQNLWNNGTPCTEWNLSTECAMTLFSVVSSSIHHATVHDPSHLWIARLLSTAESGGSDVCAISIRGTIEPGIITQQEIRRNQQALQKNLIDRDQKGFDSTPQLEEAHRTISESSTIARHVELPPSLIHCSTTLLTPGRPHDARASINLPGFEILSFPTAGQNCLLFDTMHPCSTMRFHPRDLTWSATMVTGGGLNSCAYAGDHTPSTPSHQPAALLGFTETDRQPVYLSTTSVHDDDREPLLLIIGSTGSGKTMCLLSLAFQWAQIPTRTTKKPTPVVFIDPKETSDFSTPVLAAGGHVYSMDNDLSNGIFDPMTILEDPEEAKNTAAIMLSTILDPTGQHPEWETAMTEILDYGIKHGATCCGEAITRAWDDWQHAHTHHQPTILPDLTGRVHDDLMRLASTSQTFGLIFGTTGHHTPLRMTGGLTLIQAGHRSLVPLPGSEKTVTGRIQQWVLRLTVMGAGAAVRGRDGMVILDEAWVALGADSASTVAQWGRLARSQRFTPVLASQKVQEFVDAHLEGAVSRGLLLSLDDMDDSLGTSNARNALTLLHVTDPLGRIRHRMSIDATIENGQPNWMSMKALHDPTTGHVLRGSIAYFIDGGHSPVPVDIVIPPHILADISTTPTH